MVEILSSGAGSGGTSVSISNPLMIFLTSLSGRGFGTTQSALSLFNTFSMMALVSTVRLSIGSVGLTVLF